MSALWAKISELNGKTLRTNTQHKAFKILDVTSSYVLFLPEGGNGTPRNEKKIVFTHLENLLALGERLSRGRIQEEFPSCRNSSYVAAILSSAGIPVD